MEIVGNMQIREKDRKQWRPSALYAVRERGHGNSGFNINFLIIISYNLSSLIGDIVPLQRRVKTSRKLRKLWNINIFFYK